MFGRDIRGNARRRVAARDAAAVDDAAAVLDVFELLLETVEEAGYVDVDELVEVVGVEVRDGVDGALFLGWGVSAWLSDATDCLARCGLPATLAHPSSLPCFSTVSSIHALTVAGLLMSTTLNMTRSLASGMSFSIPERAFPRFSSDVAHPETVAPLSRRYLTRARPVPRLAPVTVMILSLKGYWSAMMNARMSGAEMGGRAGTCCLGMPSVL